MKMLKRMEGEKEGRILHSRQKETEMRKFPRVPHERRQKKREYQKGGN